MSNNSANGNILKQTVYSTCLQSITLNSAYQQVQFTKITLSLHLSNRLKAG